MSIKNIELLAPVGSMESLFAAVENGANAVYLGGKLFSARQYASNFDNEELEKAIEYAHLRNVKVYITVNILIDESEIGKTLEYIKFLYDIDVDGLIVQDLGLAYLIKNIFPDFDLHASTQMTINNLQGAIFLENFGFKRVVLARETPLEEIKEIYHNSQMRLEGFIHGALCVSYSGQCLMSSIIGGRSGNRGRCAQPCRMPYSLIDYDKDEIVLDHWRDKHLLSPKDLNTLDNIETIIDSGITSLKIEGRMKRPEYVATVVKNYRKALDSGSKSLTNEDKENVAQIFNRGFTQGLPFGDFGRSFSSYDRPDNRGILVGELVDIDRDYIYIKLVKDVEQGDGIELKTNNGKYKGFVLQESGIKGQIIKINKTNNVLKNSKVTRTSSKRLLEEAKKSYQSRNIVFPIDMKVDISVGKPAKLTIHYKGKDFLVESDFIVEKSKKVGLTKDRVFEQLSKLKDTVYYIDNIDINLEEDTFMPIGSINGLRRDGVDKLDNYRSNFNKRIEISSKNFNNKLKEQLISTDKKEKSKQNVSISVMNKSQFDQLDLNKLDRVYIGFDDELKSVALKAKEKGKEVFIATDKILYKEDFNSLNKKIESVKDIVDGVAVSNLGTLQFIKENFDLKTHADIGLNVFNSYSAQALKDEGLESVTLSPELNMNQINKITDKNILDWESIVYGYLPVMNMKDCPMSLVKDCKDDSNCNDCKFASGYGLKDRKEINFYTERIKGNTVIYNSVPFFLLDSIDKIYNNGVDLVRLDFTFEKKGIFEIQNIYYDFAKGLISKEKADQYVDKYRKSGITKGHYYRGVI